nr:hypothetical protein [Butyricicoccus sp. OM06-6AC]
MKDMKRKQHIVQTAVWHQKRNALFPGGRKQGVLIDANEKSLRKGDKIKEKRLSA